MSVSFRSRAARTVLAALFALHLAACTVTQQVQLSSSPKPAELAGLTTKSGHIYTFEPAGAVISGDTLYAQGAQGQIVVPVDSIKTVAVKEFSTSHTLGLAAAIVGVLVVYVAVSNKVTGHCTACQ